jgi:hypothetical protein
MNLHGNKTYGRTALGALLALAATGIAILWSWNTLAAELFGLAPMEFRHALAAALLVVATGALFGLRGRFGRPPRE